LVIGETSIQRKSIQRERFGKHECGCPSDTGGCDTSPQVGAAPAGWCWKIADLSKGRAPA